MRNILVIDSNTDYHLLVKRKLSNTKYSVVFAQDINEARLKLGLYKFNLIIISHILKNSSGEVAVEKLQEFGYEGPILVTTSDPTCRDQYKQVKATIIDKCTNKEDFITVVRSMISPVEIEDLKEIRL